MYMQTAIKYNSGVDIYQHYIVPSKTSLSYNKIIYVSMNSELSMAVTHNYTELEDILTHLSVYSFHGL